MSNASENPKQSHIQITDVRVQFKGLVAIDDITVTIKGGRITGLIGPNGAGKTTLLNVISGYVKPVKGTVMFNGMDIIKMKTFELARNGISRGFQTVRVLEDETVRANLMLGRCMLLQASIFEQILNLPRHRNYNKRDVAAVHEVAELLQLTEYLDVPMSELPYGIRRIVEVGRIFLGESKLVLIDEPAAGLHVSDRVLLANILKLLRDKYECTVIVVDHDVEFVKNLCSEIVVLNLGKVIAQGEPNAVLNIQEVQAAYFGGEDNAQG